METYIKNNTQDTKIETYTSCKRADKSNQGIYDNPNTSQTIINLIEIRVESVI